MFVTWYLSRWQITSFVTRWLISCRRRRSISIQHPTPEIITYLCTYLLPLVGVELRLFIFLHFVRLFFGVCDVFLIAATACGGNGAPTARHREFLRLHASATVRLEVLLSARRGVQRAAAAGGGHTTLHLTLLVYFELIYKTLNSLLRASEYYRGVINCVQPLRQWNSRGTRMCNYKHNYTLFSRTDSFVSSSSWSWIEYPIYDIF